MLSRRHILPLAGLAAIGPVAVGAAEIPNARTELGYGLNVSLRLFAGQWEVMVPLHDQKWRPGFPLAIEWIPLEQFLREIEQEIA